MVNSERQLVKNAEDSIRRIFDELGGESIAIQRKALSASIPSDVILCVTSKEVKLKIAVQVKARITPQTAMSVCERMAKTPKDVISLVYAPVISPRVAEILDQYGIGYVDEAGNCQIKSIHHRLLIDRHSYKSPVRAQRGLRICFRQSPAASFVRCLPNLLKGGKCAS